MPGSEQPTMREPVTDLDELDLLDHRGRPDERRGDGHALVVARRHANGAMKEHVVDVEVQVARDGEVHGLQIPDREAEQTEPGQVAHAGIRGKGQRAAAIQPRSSSSTSSCR